MSWAVTGDSATLSWCSVTFTLDRIAPSSPMCDDPARTPC
jgi:hypothetical protein